MTQPAAAHRDSERLIRAYQRAWDDIVAQQRRIANDPKRWARQARLVEMRKEIEHRMADLRSRTEPWASTSLPKTYRMAARATAADLGESFSFTAIHQEAVEQIADYAFNELLKATRYTLRSTKRFIREAGQHYATLATTTDRTAQGAARELFRDLVDNRGIVSVKYANGATHGLGEYSEMMIRTTTATAYNKGTFTFGNEFGVEYYECFDGEECGLTDHDDPQLADGLVLPAADAEEYTISHPNCVRGWGARPDITDPADADEVDG